VGTRWSLAGRRQAAIRSVVSSSSYKVTFLPSQQTVAAVPGHSILDVALHHGIDLDHACGGVCGCSTCHIYVRTGFEALAPASDKEEDMLDNAPFLQRSSRLACQIVPTMDMVVEIPAMNRNLVAEGKH
jgi:ferredoxin, 2Fe-2S